MHKVNASRAVRKAGCEKRGRAEVMVNLKGTRPSEARTASYDARIAPTFPALHAVNLAGADGPRLHRLTGLLTMNEQQLANDGLTHFDAHGQAHMVDVGAKAPTHRVAVAEGLIVMQPQTLEIIQKGTAKKGDVLGIARIAGIMAAKQTSNLIPLCHPLSLTRVAVDFELLPASHAVRCTATVETHGQTGVEMEALTAVQISLLTIYDMCKAVDKQMVMEGVRVLEKQGGKSGHIKFSLPL